MALLRQLTLLLAGIGLVRGGSVARLSRILHNSALWVLRSAEPAVRRLVVIRAQGLTVKPRPARLAPSALIPRGIGQRLPAFPLLDPLVRISSGTRHPTGPGPRLTLIGEDTYQTFEPSLSPSAEDSVDAARLCRRIEMLFRVLEDLPRQARRLALWKARAERTWRGASGAIGQRSPLRRGRPPGFRKRARHPVDEILSECDVLVRMAMKPPI